MLLEEGQEQNLFETGIVQSLVTKDDVVLDIGANVGYFTILLASLAKHVHAFEPEPNNFKQLEQNTQHLDNVTNYQIALSNHTGFSTLYTCPTDNGMNRLYDSQWCKGGNEIVVGTTTIDTLSIIFLRNKKIKFIKMDVEGLEYKVLQGMRQLLQRDHPIIMMECHPPSIEEAGDSPRALYEFLKNEMGYDDPINCITNGTIISYDKLEENTRHSPAINILWKYNK
jgi:FkbM family methyltransferase